MSSTRKLQHTERQGLAAQALWCAQSLRPMSAQIRLDSYIPTPTSVKFAANLEVGT